MHSDHDVVAYVERIKTQANIISMRKRKPDD